MENHDRFYKKNIPQANNAYRHYGILIGIRDITITTIRCALGDSQL